MASRNASKRPGRVLVVDDEPPIRDAVRRALVASGYEVMDAANGLEGVAVLETGIHIDLVVADLAMPELSGAEMVCRIRGARPDLKILYVTGFIDSLMDTRPLWEGEAFLEKPFSLAGLREAVSMLLYGTLAPPPDRKGVLAKIGGAAAAVRHIVSGTVALLVTFALAAANVSAQPPPQDVTRLSLEDLLDVQVVSTASKFPQSTREAPASVTVIGSTDIRRFGYRTLADALQSVRGFYTTYDRNYAYVGVRGFGRPGDYNTRMLLLIDGQRVNDGIFDMAPIGTDFPVPMSLVERIEIIRGPGSSLYGSNALFGVINVVTKTGGDRKGLQVEAQGGSLGTGSGAASYGRLFGDGTEILVASSGYTSAGQSRIHYPEFDRIDEAPGIATNLDHDDVATFLGSLSAGRFSLRATGARRHKRVPTAAFGSVFGDPRASTTDTRVSISSVYDGPLGRSWMVSARLAYDHYAYHGDYPTDYGADGVLVYEDASFAHSVTTEVTARRRFATIHQFSAGAEVRHHLQARQVASDALAQYIDLDMPGTSVGLYAQHEIRARSWLLINVGGRIDRFVEFGTRATPRAAIVLLPRARTAVKLLHGRAFRAPNSYERYYYNHELGLSDALQPEQIRSSELVWEESVSRHIRATVSAFIYDVDHLIEQRATLPLTGVDGFYFANAGGTRARGVEAEVEGRFDNGVTVQISHTVTRARDRERSTVISNSPANLFKASAQIPVHRLLLAIGAQYVGERLTLGGHALGGFVISNASLTTPEDKRLSIGVTVYNLFNRSYADPGGEEHVQASIGQDGRTILLRARVRF